MPYVYSTLSQDVVYSIYAPKISDTATQVPVVLKKVHIRGGANTAVYSKRNGEGRPMDLHTPYGVVTEVSDADLEALRVNKVFERHVKAGHIVIDVKKVEADKAAKDMATKDGMAQKVAEDFPKEGPQPTKLKK